MPPDADDADDNNDFPGPVPKGRVPVDAQSLEYDGSSVCDDDALFQACIEAKGNLPSVDSQGLSNMSSDHSAEQSVRLDDDDGDSFCDFDLY